MYDNRIFSADCLGSKEEENSLQYYGWAILAHVRAENQAQVIQWVKYTFNSDGYEFNERDNRYFVQSDLCDSPIEVIPEKIRYKDTYTLKIETFNVWFQSEVFGYKWYEEFNHRKLCYEILSKIRKKRGFWLKEGKLFPMPKMTRTIRPQRRYQFSIR